MSEYLLFTHTQWSEAPRIRHQVTRLLLDAGHTVLFFERPGNLWDHRDTAFEEVEPGLTLVRTSRLLHHQLRALPLLHRLNAWVVSGEIRRRLRERGVTESAPRIINFTHDYYFLRRLFPGARITTIIHDDFEAQSRLPMTAHIAWSLRRTCRMSDEVFAVSTPLQERLRAWCDPKLLLPWAVVPYRAPSPGTQQRDTLLFWGYVDTAIDLAVVRRLSEHLRSTRPSWSMLFVGPTQGHPRARQAMVDGMAGLSNVEIRGRTNLDDLPLDRTLAALAPYRRFPAQDAVTLANKSMQLLARGLPLLISGMPAYIQRPFIQRLDGPEGMEHALTECQSKFDAWQPSIRAFVEENSPASRMRLLGIEPAQAASPPAAPARVGSDPSKHSGR